MAHDTHPPRVPAEIASAVEELLPRLTQRDAERLGRLVELLDAHRQASLATILPAVFGDVAAAHRPAYLRQLRQRVHAAAERIDRERAKAGDATARTLRITDAVGEKPSTPIARKRIEVRLGGHTSTDVELLRRLAAIGAPPPSDAYAAATFVAPRAIAWSVRSSLLPGAEAPSRKAPPSAPTATGGPWKGRPMAELEKEFGAVLSAHLDPKRAQRFEQWFAKLCKESGIVTTTQIDRRGSEDDPSLLLDGERYLFDVKRVLAGAGPDQLAPFHERVTKRADAAGGFFVSAFGFSGDALHWMTEGREPRFCFVDGGDLRAVLRGEIRLDVLLRAKLEMLHSRSVVSANARNVLQDSALLLRALEPGRSEDSAAAGAPAQAAAARAPEPAREARPAAQHALGALRRWAESDAAPGVAVVLGEAGSGKTFLARRFASSLHTYPLRGRIGAYADVGTIPLAASAPELSVQQILRHWLRRAGEADSGVDALVRATVAGQTILILDGADRLAASLDGPRSAALWGELAILGRGRGKVMITCRKEAFDSDASVREAFPNALVLELEPFEARRAASAWRRAGRKGTPAAKGALAELAARPGFLQKFAALDGLAPTEQIERLAEEWLDRDRQRGLLSTAAKRRALEAVAAALWKQRSSTIRADELESCAAKAVRRLLPNATLATLQSAVHDLRSSSLLARDEAGAVRFVHPAIQEYFLARAVARVLAKGRGESLKNMPFPEKVAQRAAEIARARRIPEAEPRRAETSASADHQL
ncbi:MAG: NACHT domain-containing protein [Planctomycetes bacterium]|nr:NACHT domain-containing protein [Planctomycetota bacterium]